MGITNVALVYFLIFSYGIFTLSCIGGLSFVLQVFKNKFSIALDMVIFIGLPFFLILLFVQIMGIITGLPALFQEVNNLDLLLKELGIKKTGINMISIGLIIAFAFQILTLINIEEVIWKMEKHHEEYS
jgi:hypothetical protein